MGAYSQKISIIERSEKRRAGPARRKKETYRKRGEKGEKTKGGRIFFTVQFAPSRWKSYAFGQLLSTVVYVNLKSSSMILLRWNKYSTYVD